MVPGHAQITTDTGMLSLCHRDCAFYDLFCACLPNFTECISPSLTEGIMERKDSNIVDEVPIRIITFGQIMTGPIQIHVGNTNIT